MSTDAKHTNAGAQAVIADAADPARRKDVLFRVRRAPGHEMSSWWPISAFLVTTIAVVALLNFVPSGA